MNQQANKSDSDAAYHPTAAAMAKISDEGWYTRLQYKTRMWVVNTAYWGGE